MLQSPPQNQGYYFPTGAKLAQAYKSNKLRLSYEYQVMLRTNPNRFHEIKFVKLIVRKCCRLILESALRYGHSLHCLTKREISVMKYIQKSDEGNTRDVQSYSSKMRRYLRDVINGSALPMLHLNLDFWTCSTSHGKYIGIRICFCQ